MAFFNNITQIRLNGTDMDEVHLNSNKVYPVPKPKLYLEYIESTGTQWINTLVYPTKFTRIELDFQYTANTIQNKTRLFGERRVWNNGFYLGTSTNAAPGASYWYLFYDKYDYNGIGTTDLNRHTVSLDTDYFKVDGNILKTFNNTASLNVFAPICLFGVFDENATTPTTGIYKMYGCKIYENGVLIKDYVPVLDQNDVACLYDRVNKEFIYNSGTGDFSYSLINSYIPVNCLMNSNTRQYIDTGYVYTSNSARIDTKFQQKATQNDAVFGYYVNNSYYKTVLTAYSGKYYISNNEPTGITYSIGVDHEISVVINGNDDKTGTYTITENGSIIGSNNNVGVFPDSTRNNTMILFAQQDPNYGISSGPLSKIYYFKMWDNGVLVRDFIPVLKESSVPCMYDRVTKLFYLDGRGGTFNYE